MKKLITILFMACVLFGQAQLTNVPDFKVANASTAIGRNISIGTKIYNTATGDYWVATASVASTATLTTAAASFTKLNSDLSSYKLKSDSVLNAGYFTNYKATLKEDKSNKENTTVDNSSTKYPTVNLLKTYTDGKVSDAAYSGSWDGATTLAPSQNAIYDKINSLEPVNYSAATMTVNFGTLNQGVVADLAAVGGTDVIIQERVANPPFTVTFTFTGVQRLSGFKFYGRYNGSSSHNVHVEAYNYTTTTWDYLGEISTTTNKQWYSYSLNLPNNYLSSNNAQFRISHQGTGITSHQMIMDYVNANYGGGGGANFITAGAVEFVPSGNIVATNTQAAIEEVDSEKEPVLTKGNLTENITGLEFDATRQVIGGAAVLSLTTGYQIPTTTQVGNIHASNSDNQTLTIAGTTSPTIALSGSNTATFSGGGIVSLNQSAGTITITGTEADGSTSNELQTLSSSGAAGNITLSNGGGTLSLNVNDADASTTNEIQDLSGSGATLSGYTLSLSSDGTPVVLPSEADGSVTNEIQTITNSSDATSHTVTLSNSGGTVQLVEGSNITLTTSGTGSAGVVTIASAGGGVTDHGGLTGLSDDDHTHYTKADGTRAFTGIVSYSSHPTFTTDAQMVDKKYVDDAITAGGGYTDEQAQDAAGAMVSGNTETGIDVSYDDATAKLNFTATDASTTNELNSSVSWTDGTNTLGVVDAGGTKSVAITGFLESEVDGSVSNEIQDLSGSGATLSGYTISLSSDGSSVVLPSEADGSTSNEIQDLSGSGATLSGYVISLSSDGTNVTLPSEADGSTTNEIEVADEAYSSANFNGGTAAAVSQDDFYDYNVISDTDDDGLPNKVDLSTAGFAKVDASGVLSADANTYLYDKYPATMTSNTTYIGTTITGTAGENLVYGDFVYYKFSDGRWWKASASAYATARTRGIAVGTINTAASGSILIEGIIRHDTWNWTAAEVWLSTTAGTGTSTQPSTTGNQIQFLGTALGADNLLFTPSQDIGEK